MPGMRKFFVYRALFHLTVDLLASLRTYGTNVHQSRGIRSSGRR
jgi:hypothetical protein